MKKKGMTIIESIVTIALLGLIFTLVAPIIRGFGKVNNRVKTQKEIDREFANINEFIQKKVKSAKSSDGSGEYAKVFESLSDFPGTSTSQEGDVLYFQVPIESTSPDEVLFIFDKTDVSNKKLQYSKDAGNNKETLMENLADATFKFQEGIILYHIDLDIGEYEGKLRSSFKGSASTRINID